MTRKVTGLVKRGVIPTRLFRACRACQSYPKACSNRASVLCPVPTMDLLFTNSSDSENDQAVAHIIRRRKVYRLRINFDLDDFVARFRLSRAAVERIIQDIGPQLQHDSDKNMALSPTQRLLLAFRYLASGGFMLMVGDAHGPAKATVSRAVHADVSVINNKYVDSLITWPENVESVVAGFLHNCEDSVLRWRNRWLARSNQGANYRRESLRQPTWSTFDKYDDGTELMLKSKKQNS